MVQLSRPRKLVSNRFYPYSCSLKQTQGKKGMGQGNMSRTFGNQGNSGFVTSPDYDGFMSPRSKGPSIEDTKSNYGYAPKSRVLYSRKGVGSA